MLTILCDNPDKEVAIVTDESASNLWIYANGKRYHPTTFRPAFGNGRQLREDKRETANSLMSAAYAELERLRESKAPVIEYVEKVVEVPVENPRTSFADALQDNFLKVLTSQATEQLLQDVLPVAREQINRELVEKYGMVPVVHEIRIPEKKSWQTTEVLHEKFDAIVNILSLPKKHGVYLCGPAGTGKSYIAQQLAKVFELEYYVANAVTDEVQLTGFIDANGRYHETEFYKAFTKGGVFLLDELDASISDVLTILNNALANGYFPFPNGRASVHADFKCVAAGNTFGTGADDMYTGRSVIDAATNDRFAMIKVEYDKRIEMGITGGDEVAIDFAHAYRAAAKKAGISTLLTYRGLSRMVDFSAFMSKRDALEIGVTKGMASDDILILATAIKDSGHASEWLDALREIAKGV